MSDKKMFAGKFCWNELVTPDLKKAKAFYQTVFGWEFKEIPSGDMTYTLIQKGDEQGLGGMWEIPTDQKAVIPPHWMSYIFVEDLEASLKLAEANGATVCLPITQAGEMGRFVIISDPTGAKVSMWESKEHCK